MKILTRYWTDEFDGAYFVAYKPTSQLYAQKYNLVLNDTYIAHAPNLLNKDFCQLDIALENKQIKDVPFKKLKDEKWEGLRLISKEELNNACRTEPSPPEPEDKYKETPKEEPDEESQIQNNVQILLSSKHNSDKAQGRQLLAEHLRSKHNFLTILGEKNDEVYNYENGIYVQKGVAVIKQEIELYLQDLANNLNTNEILNKIKRMTRIERCLFDETPKNLICLNNGIYDINKDKFISHTPEHKFLAKIKTDYVAGAECPTILKVLRELVDEDTLIDLQELAGYCLLRSNKFKKAFIIEGPGDSGKTTFLKLLEHMIGINNIAVSSLQYLCDDKNGTATLYGKMCNFYDDLSFDAIRNPGKLKMLTGNFYVPAERKYHDQFTFLNEATLVSTCNQIPEPKNADGAYYGRFIVILFNKIIPVEKQDRDLLDKLVNELPGFLLWAIKGLKRLEKQNKFSYKWTAQQVQEYMERSCSNISEFVQDCLEEDSNSFMTRDELYDAYVEYCNNKDIDANNRKTKRTLGEHFLRYCRFAQDGRKNIPGHKNARVWRCIRLKSKKDSNFEISSGEAWDYDNY